MYKVFIQNRPVFFISNEDLSNFNAVILPFHVVMEAQEVFHKFLENYGFNCPICILTQDIEREMNQFFARYDFIEAAGGIVVKDSKILTIKRNGVWDLPKGKIDTGETPEIAAVREVEEECGIQNPTLGELITITYHCYDYKGRPSLKKTYWYNMTYQGDDALVGQLNEGITKVKWKSFKKTQKRMENSYGSIQDVLSAFFSQKS